MASSSPNLPSPELGAEVGRKFSLFSRVMTVVGGGGWADIGAGGGAGVGVNGGGGGAGGTMANCAGGGGGTNAGCWSSMLVTTTSLTPWVVASTLMSGRSPTMSSGRSAMFRVGTMAGSLPDCLN